MLAGLPVGRVAVPPTFISLSLSCSLFCPFPPLLPSSFHLPAYPARSPLPPRPGASRGPPSRSAGPPPLVPPAAAHSRELLFDCFITLINAARRHDALPTWGRSRGSARRAFSFVAPEHHTRSIVADQKDANFNLTLSNIIYVCARRLEGPADARPSQKSRFSRRAAAFFRSMGNHGPAVYPPDGPWLHAFLVPPIARSSRSPAGRSSTFLRAFSSLGTREKERKNKATIE